jgi:exosortase
MTGQASPFAALHVQEEIALPNDQQQSSWIALAVLVLLLILGYWNMLEYTASFWSKPLYSHGYLIPLFTAGLLWHKRKPLTQVQPYERWIGVVVLLLSLSGRLYASYFDINPLDRLSFLFALLGVCQIVGGFSLLKWAGLPILFLAFMFPLPSAFENSILLWLQNLAARCSTWVLQTLGVAALREGNRIVIENLPLDVADACSGLRMSTIFGAMSVALALVIDRPWWDRITILVFAIPVALLTNIIRITVTGLLYMTFPGNEAVQHYVHDWAGLAMMPIALGFLWIEMTLLYKLTVPMEAEDYSSFGALQG